MNYVYIDESGDLGRAAKSSRFVVIASIATNEPRRLEKIVRKVWTTKQHKKDAGELHAIEANDSVRIKLLSLMDEMAIQITFTVIDKIEFLGDLHEQYYVALKEQVNRHPGAQVYIVDKRDTNKKRIEIISSLGLKAEFKRVQFVDSRSVRQLQAVDFASWSIYQLIENKDPKYVDVIRRRIVGELT